MAGRAADASDPLFLRAFGVPFWALARVFGRDHAYWYRLEVGLGRHSVAGPTDWGGQGLPHAVSAVCTEMWNAASMAFGLGPMLGFLFIFQTLQVAPLSIASGAVGFADYLRFYWTGMSPAAHDLVAALVPVKMTLSPFRNGEVTVILAPLP